MTSENKSSEKMHLKLLIKYTTRLETFYTSLYLEIFCVLTNDTEQALWKCIYHENDLIDEKFHLNH